MQGSGFLAVVDMDRERNNSTEEDPLQELLLGKTPFATGGIEPKPCSEARVLLVTGQCIHHQPGTLHR